MYCTFSQKRKMGNVGNFLFSVRKTRPVPLRNTAKVTTLTFYFGKSSVAAEGGGASETASPERPASPVFGNPIGAIDAPLTGTTGGNKAKSWWSVTTHVVGFARLLRLFIPFIVAGEVMLCVCVLARRLLCFALRQRHWLGHTPPPPPPSPDATPPSFENPNRYINASIETSKHHVENNKKKLRCQLSILLLLHC